MENKLSTTEMNLKNSGTNHLQILRVEDAILSGLPTLAKLNKSEPDKLTDAINLLISDLALFVNVGKQMNKSQVIETAEFIKTEYYFLNIADLQLCFKNIKKGKYGQLYDRLDGQIIMNFIQQYSDERLWVGENITQKDTNETLALDKGEPDYCVMIGDKYFCLLEDSFKETKHKELATRFEMLEAKYYKSELIKNHYSVEPEKIKIKWFNKGGGLMDYLKEKNPGLAKEIEKIGKAKELTRKHSIETARIEAQELTEFEKENAKRKLVYLKPLTEFEFEHRKELLKASEK